MIFLKPSTRTGQALVEAMVAISVITIGFLGIVALLSQSLGLSRVVSEQYIATHLASEGTELVKNLIDAGTIRGDAWGSGFPDGDYAVDVTTDWDGNPPSLIVGAPQPVLLEETTGVYSYQGGTETRFTRVVQISHISADEIKVNSIVAWVTRGGASYAIDVEDHFYNWR